MNISKRQRARLKNKRFWLCAPWFILTILCVIPFYFMHKLSEYAIYILGVLYLVFDDLVAFVGVKIFRTHKIVKWIDSGDKD